jgi:hypothetical protein
MLIPAKYHSWILVEANFGHHVPQNNTKKTLQKTSAYDISQF